LVCTDGKWRSLITVSSAMPNAILITHDVEFMPTLLEEYETSLLNPFKSMDSTSAPGGAL